MEIVISISPWVVELVSDILLDYICIGSLVLLPWSIYRSSGNRCSTYWHALTIKGCWLFVSIWILWPRALYGMYKGW